MRSRHRYLLTAQRWLPLVTLSVILRVFFPASCAAVVIDTGDGTGNVTAPDDDPGFANVGIRGIGSAIYLGNRWVMTASHLGAGPVTFGGTEYSHISGETVQLTNPDEDLTELTDILLFRLQEDPGLPALRLPCLPVAIGSEFILIGRGHDRNPELTYWDVVIKGGANNDLWTIVGSKAASDRQGYGTQSTQTIRWGQGIATLTEFDTEAGWGDVLSFQSSFDPNLKLEYVAQGVRGDSGGPVFQKNWGLWELIGMIHAVSLLDNQPDATRTAIYGNETFIADLFQYADQIREFADFEPDPGDLNGDGTIDDVDIDALLDVVRFPKSVGCHVDAFDLAGNGNGIDGDDVTAIVHLAGGLLGDANLDGEVGFSDFLTLSSAFGSVETTWRDGDFDGDDQVSFADFLILSQNFGQSYAPEANAVAVPEPIALTPFSGGGMLVSALALRRRRR